MIPELGHFALILALSVAFIQAVVPLVGAQRGDVQWMAVARPAALIQFVLIAIAFACLTQAYVTSDFSVLNVVRNSHSAKPMLYKISGVWANHGHRARNILEQGDLEEGLNAASAIGDDRLQKQGRGYVTPESFTHGSSAQRVKWFRHGLETGDMNQCDTFSSSI